jgi:hypothetical protein
MKSGNFVELTFVVKGELQVEFINVEHISRIMYVDGKPFIGMLGQTYTRQLTETSMQDLIKCISSENDKLK